MDLRGDHMKMFALISILSVSFTCTATAADVGVTATGQTQIATLKWARDMGSRHAILAAGIPSFGTISR
jgi:hypothetical protein